jgi:hypothetical protein
MIDVTNYRKLTEPLEDVLIVLYIPEVLQIQESQAIIVCLRSVMISTEMSNLSTMELTEDVSNVQADKWLAP